jgi:hypothetical protein
MDHPFLKKNVILPIFNGEHVRHEYKVPQKFPKNNLIFSETGVVKKYLSESV